MTTSALLLTLAAFTLITLWVFCKARNADRRAQRFIALLRDADINRSERGQ